MLFKIALPS
jgi:hypothetical protein